MTPERLREIEQLCEAMPKDAPRWWPFRSSAKAYAGRPYDGDDARSEVRWYVSAAPPEHECHDPMSLSSWVGHGVWTSDGVTTETHARFIAESRAAVPEMLAYIRQLEARLARADLAVEAAADQSLYEVARQQASMDPRVWFEARNHGIASGRACYSLDPVSYGEWIDRVCAQPEDEP